MASGRSDTSESSVVPSSITRILNPATLVAIIPMDKARTRLLLAAPTAAFRQLISPLASRQMDMHHRLQEGGA